MLESAPARDRPAGQREDESAPAGRGRGTQGCRAGAALLPGRLRRGELRGRHCRGILAGVSDQPGDSSSAPGGGVRPVGAGRSLSRRAAGLRRPGGQAARADGREREHVVRGHGRSRCGLAVAKDPPDRAADHRVRERDQPLRRDRPPGPRPVRPLPDPPAAPPRHETMRRSVGDRVRPPPSARDGSFAGDPNRGESAGDLDRGPLRRRRGPGQLVEALIRFMQSYYSPPELKDISARMVHDAAGPGAEMRSLHRIALARLMELPSVAKCRGELLAMMPAGVVAVSCQGSAPADVAQTTAAGMRADDDRAERSQGSPGESAETAARELFETTAALNGRNRAEDTVEAYDEVIRRFGESEIPAVLVWAAKALVNKGTVLRDLKRPQDALEASDEVVCRFGKSETPALLERVATALVNRGAVLGVLNRPQDALEACDEVVRRFGESKTPALLERVAGALVNRGAVLGVLNRPQDALEVCDEVVCRFGKSEIPALLERVATALVNRGAVLGVLKRPQDALEACDEVVRRFGKSETPALLERVAGALVNRGAVLGVLKRPQDVLEACDEVVRRFGKSETPALLERVATALGNRGAVLGVLNRPQDALEACDEVVRRFGESKTPALLERVAGALVNRGAVLGVLNRPQDALEVCDEVVRRFGESKTQALLERVATALGNRGAVLSNLNRPQDALEACDEVIRRFWESDSSVFSVEVKGALLWRADIELKTRQYEKAVETAGRVINRRHRGSPEQQLRGHVIQAKALLAGGDRSAGEHAVEAVLAILPELGSISREGLMALMDFSVDLGPQRTCELIQTSPSAPLLLPLTTALERELGHEPRVAREVGEVAQDIQRTLADRKSEMNAAQRP